MKTQKSTKKISKPYSNAESQQSNSKINKKNKKSSKNNKKKKSKQKSKSLINKNSQIKSSKDIQDSISDTKNSRAKPKTLLSKYQRLFLADQNDYKKLGSSPDSFALSQSWKASHAYSSSAIKQRNLQSQKRRQTIEVSKQISIPQQVRQRTKSTRIQHYLTVSHIFDYFLQNQLQIQERHIKKAIQIYMYSSAQSKKEKLQNIISKCKPKNVQAQGKYNLDLDLYLKNQSQLGMELIESQKELKLKNMPEIRCQINISLFNPFPQLKFDNLNILSLLSVKPLTILQTVKQQQKQENNEVEPLLTQAQMQMQNLRNKEPQQYSISYLNNNSFEQLDQFNHYQSQITENRSSNYSFYQNESLFTFYQHQIYNINKIEQKKCQQSLLMEKQSQNIIHQQHSILSIQQRSIQIVQQGPMQADQEQPISVVQQPNKCIVSDLYRKSSLLSDFNRSLKYEFVNQSRLNLADCTSPSNYIYSGGGININYQQSEQIYIQNGRNQDQNIQNYTQPQLFFNQQQINAFNYNKMKRSQYWFDRKEQQNLDQDRSQFQFIYRDNQNIGSLCGFNNQNEMKSELLLNHQYNSIDFKPFKYRNSKETLKYQSQNFTTNNKFNIKDNRFNPILNQQNYEQVHLEQNGQNKHVQKFNCEYQEYYDSSLQLQQDKQYKNDQDNLESYQQITKYKKNSNNLNTNQHLPVLNISESLQGQPVISSQLQTKTEVQQVLNSVQDEQGRKMEDVQGQKDGPDGQNEEGGQDGSLQSEQVFYSIASWCSDSAEKGGNFSNKQKSITYNNGNQYENANPSSKCGKIDWSISNNLIHNHSLNYQKKLQQKSQDRCISADEKDKPQASKDQSVSNRQQPAINSSQSNNLIIINDSFENEQSGKLYEQKQQNINRNIQQVQNIQQQNLLLIASKDKQEKVQVQMIKLQALKFKIKQKMIQSLNKGINTINFFNKIQTSQTYDDKVTNNSNAIETVDQKRSQQRLMLGISNNTINLLSDSLQSSFRSQAGDNCKYKRKLITETTKKSQIQLTHIQKK